MNSIMTTSPREASPRSAPTVPIRRAWTFAILGFSLLLSPVLRAQDDVPSVETIFAAFAERYEAAAGKKFNLGYDDSDYFKIRYPNFPSLAGTPSSTDISQDITEVYKAVFYDYNLYPTRPQLQKFYTLAETFDGVLRAGIGS